MLGTKESDHRTVEQLVRRAGYAIHDAPHCRRGHWYQVGGRVHILAPTWLPGVDVREGIIARQLVLYGLAASGEAAFAAGLATMTARYAGRHTGPVAAPLADGEAAG
jgi:hypothetical protein